MKATFKPQLVPASINDYPTVQNMARFYVYDMSRYCGFISEDWACPTDGLYESYDFKSYFEDPTREAFLVKIANELAGFVLLNRLGTSSQTDWNMGEFFIIAKFQGKGVAMQVAHQIWETHPGQWEICIMPENKPALVFWRKVVSHSTQGNYLDEMKTVDYLDGHPIRPVLTFNIKR